MVNGKNGKLLKQTCEQTSQVCFFVNNPIKNPNSMKKKNSSIS